MITAIIAIAGSDTPPSAAASFTSAPFTIAILLSSTFTADSTKGLNLILNEGMDKIAGYEEELRGASGSAEEMANIMNDNLSGDVAAMNSAFEELGLKIYDALESKLRAGVQFITNGLDSVPDRCDLIPKFFVVFP